MKIRLSLFCIALLTLFNSSVADAQQFGPVGSELSPGLTGEPQFRRLSGDLLQGPGRVGRLWFEANFADQGLGFENSFFTIGGKTRLFQDALDGRWLFEAQANHAIEDNGGFFANIGISRVFSIKAANADISTGVFYDYDGDDQQFFSDGFHQIGLSGSIKTPRWDLIANGYIPVGTDSFSSGSLTETTSFVGSNIALQSGLESALEGFDVTIRTRPHQLAFVNGFFDIGAYHYDADTVDSFAGGRLRTGFQLPNGIIFSAEVNQDERFDTTGFISVGYVFGGTNGGFGNEYAGLARDLENTVRNDHIVRFSQDLVLAIDPTTGLPFNVIHANNTQLGFGDGTVESPFATLAEAESASGVGDIIFVDTGDGTDQGYDQGITLQDNQQLLSSGSPQFITLDDGTLLDIGSRGFGGGATISNAGSNEVVRLANNNVVGGINIDAAGTNFGIFGAGITSGTFNGVNLSGAALDGIGLQAVAGDFAFNNNNITGNGRDGIFVDGSFDPNSTYIFSNNIVNTNGRDGIHLLNYDADVVNLVDNETSFNGRHGLFLENALDSNNNGTALVISDHEAEGNGADGVQIAGGSGSLLITDPDFTNNAGVGLNVTNWTTPGFEDSIFIGGVGTAEGQFNGNAVGVNLELVGDGLVSNILFTQSRVDDNGRGILVTADGANSVLNLDINNITSISGNESEGIRFDAAGGATINNTIENPALTPLIFAGNNINSSGTISFSLSGDAGDPLTQINSVIRNVDIDTAATVNSNGIDVVGAGNSRIQLEVLDSEINSAQGANILLDNDGNQAVNRLFFDNLVVSGDNGFSFFLADGTFTDLSITNSIIQSNGILPTPADIAGFTNTTAGAFPPFTDLLGTIGVIVNATGSTPPGPQVFDNLTRINIANNVINDFTFNAVDISSFGDAQLLLDFTSNQIRRNGPGLNNDPDDDGIFEGPMAPTVVPTEEFFSNGFEITAFGTSTISGNIVNNAFVDNFERAIQIGTVPFGNAGLIPGIDNNPGGFGTINLVIADNLFASDIGFDATNPTMVATNNIVGEIGVFNSLNGSISLDFEANAFQNFLPVDIQNSFVFGPPLTTGIIQIGLQGTSNGFTATGLPGLFTPTPFGLTDTLVTNEELFFEANGFPPTP